MAFYICLQNFSRNMYEQKHFHYYSNKAASLFGVMGVWGACWLGS